MEREAKINAWIIFGLPALGSMVAMLLPLFRGPERFLVSAMLFTGGYLVLHSKIKLKQRTKKLIEMGMEGMTTKEMVRYVIGYLLLVLAIGSIAWIYLKVSLI